MTSFLTVHILQVPDLSVILNLPAEASLGHIGIIRARLAQNELELQREINSLQNELKRDQDPGRMQLIQEMISVSFNRPQCRVSTDQVTGPAWPDVTHPRKGN
jgi:hypothetical protein